MVVGGSARGGLRQEPVASRRRRAQLSRLAMLLCLAAAIPDPALAQVDQQRAEIYFREAAELCEREGGKLWGVSLCGPMVFSDPAAKTIATNQAAPEAPRPPALGYANSSLDWGGVRWSTYVWQMIPAEDRHARGRLMLHELFHRVQPQLGFVLREGNNDHLDTLDGRYWMQLEWRALARALGSSGPERVEALRDALAFRSVRRAQFPGAAENERLLEINEGLAQYTGTVASSASTASAAADAIDQLARSEKNQTFVRTFAYASGAAYGILLDAWAPGWTRKIKTTDDLGQLVMSAANIQPAESAAAVASRYNGAALRVAEEKREAERKALIADFRRRFVEGPVLVLPRDGNASFTTAGITPIPGVGTIYPNFRVNGEWGSLEAATVLMSADRTTLTLPAPVTADGSAPKGEGWTLTLAPGWVARPGPRAGDFRVVHEGG